MCCNNCVLDLTETDLKRYELQTMTKLNNQVTFPVHNLSIKENDVTGERIYWHLSCLLRWALIKIYFRSLENEKWSALSDRFSWKLQKWRSWGNWIQHISVIFSRNLLYANVEYLGYSYMNSPPNYDCLFLGWYF